MAADNQREARSGGDPVTGRESTSAPLLRDIVEEVIQTRRVSCGHPQTERKWRRYFADMVFPTIGDKPIDQVTLAD